jgi:hypothetical protein
MYVYLHNALAKIATETSVELDLRRERQRLSRHAHYPGTKTINLRNLAYLKVIKINRRWMVDFKDLSDAINEYNERDKERKKQILIAQQHMEKAREAYKKHELDISGKAIEIGDGTHYSVMGTFHYLVSQPSAYYSYTHHDYDPVVKIICNQCWSPAKKEIERGDECASCSNSWGMVSCDHNDTLIRIHCENCSNEYRPNTRAKSEAIADMSYDELSGYGMEDDYPT